MAYNSCIDLPDSCVHNNNNIVTCIVNWDATPRVQIARGLRDGTPFHYLGSYLPRSRQEDESLRRGKLENGWIHPLSNLSDKAVCDQKSNSSRPLQQGNDALHAKTHLCSANKSELHIHKLIYRPL